MLRKKNSQSADYNFVAVGGHVMGTPNVFGEASFFVFLKGTGIAALFYDGGRPLSRSVHGLGPIVGGVVW